MVKFVQTGQFSMQNRAFVYMTEQQLNETEPQSTRKRGKAQRVAHQACANATVHFLLTDRLAMLLPPCE